MLILLGAGRYEQSTEQGAAALSNTLTSPQHMASVSATCALAAAEFSVADASLSTQYACAPTVKVTAQIVSINAQIHRFMGTGYSDPRPISSRPASTNRELEIEFRIRSLGCKTDRILRLYDYRPLM